MAQLEKAMSYDTVAFVLWEDPMTHSGEWVSKDVALALKGAPSLTVGVLVSADKYYIRLALDVNKDGEANGVGVIPMRCVTEIKLVPIPKGFRL